MKRILCLSLSLLLLLSACSLRTEAYYQVTYLDVFDTVTVISGYAKNEQAFLALATQMHEDLLDYHRSYDIYHTYPDRNNLCTLNAAAGKGALPVGLALLNLLQYGTELCVQTDGAINIAMGSVLSLWHDARTVAQDSPDTAALPEDAALQHAAEHTDIRNLILDFDACTAELRDPEMQLDVGAIAKGYAVEEVARKWEAQGVTGFLLNVGGNVRTIGSSIKRQGWTIGLENPDGGALLHRVRLSQGAVVTSGSYQRYFTVDGKRYHHIISPDTLYPAAYYQSVTLIGPDSALADALSTALFNTPLEKAQQLLSRFSSMQALWRFEDGTEVLSDGLDSYLIP